MDNLDVIVIENSASCNFKCRACPTVFAYNYPQSVMKNEIFYRLLNNISPDIFPKCALMGWGEPFLDPCYFEKLIELKKRGYMVGSTTNMALINEEMMNRLIDAQLDQLNISIDSNHINPKHRLDFDQIRQKLNTIFILKEKKSGIIRIGVNIIIFKSDRKFLFLLMDILKEYPFENFGFAPLIMIPSKGLYRELVNQIQLIAFQKALKKRFEKLPISFSYMDDSPIGNCRSDVFKNVYVNYNGYVSPCCMLSMDFPNVSFDGIARKTKILQFGCLADSEFSKIWNNHSFVAFRQRFREKSIPNECNCCNVWRNIPLNLSNR